MTDNSVISTETFTYDAASNITSDSSDTEFVYDTNNRLTSYNGNSVSYDLDGNMLSNGSLTCTYDSSNKLITAGGHTYTYNAEDVRIHNLCTDEDTTYTYDTNCKLSKLLTKTTDGVVTKYVYGNGLIGEETNSTFRTYHFDFRGSTVAITDSNGTITDTFAYDTYGKLISRTGTSKVIFGYNGRDGVVTEDNGLIYMRARYYSPDMRRFVNADIIHGDISNAVTLNRYAYANGNPVSNTDPFGLWSWDWVEDVGDWFVDAGKTIADTAETVGSAISDCAVTVGKAIVDGSVTAGQFIGNTAVTAGTAIADGAKNLSHWADKNIVTPVNTFVNDVKEDIDNYDPDNTDEQKVLNSNYFSSYQGKLSIKLPIKQNAFSFGAMFIGYDVDKRSDAVEIIKHEYGHTEQLDEMGVIKYLDKVAIPSVTAYNLDKKGKLPYDYYSSPWEAEANTYGGAKFTPTKSKKWTERDGYYDLWDLIQSIID